MTTRPAATARRVCSRIAAPAPLKTPAAMSSGIAQPAAHASAASPPVTLLRIGGMLSIAGVVSW
jgi:hypothetical protein